MDDSLEPNDDHRRRPIKVFVSHTHIDHDTPLLKRLEDDLMFTAKVNVWFANQDLDARYDIQSFMAGELASSDYFLFVVSKNTSTSDWMRREIELAKMVQFKQQRLRVIPVLVDKNSSWRQPANAIDFTGDYRIAYRALCDTMGLGFKEPIGLFDLGPLDSPSSVIQVCKFFDQRMLEALHNSPDLFQKLSHRDFEKLIAEIFDGLGYEVELTKRTRDGGRDVIAIRRAEVNLRYLIECKHPDKRKTIGVRPVRELLGVKADNRASKAILATTAYFSQEAQLFFERNRWELEGRDREGVLDWIAQCYKRG
ncbi:MULTISPECIES: restriction endonuclease [unclassified Methylibium]|uniref:restriction endonuclease n=1 Tax=unclassified Methylibium TaxID=2633235 RepID=UPI0013768A5C|nr:MULTISPECIES: restriction endonuclease [unclassified Methylibium]